MKCRLGFPKEDQTIIFWKAGLVTFRLVQHRCSLYCVPLPSGLGGTACNKIWGCRVQEKMKIYFRLNDFKVWRCLLFPKPDRSNKV
jgi:hypothetical protein